VATGRLQLALAAPPDVTVATGDAAGEHHDNEGCRAFPLPASQLDDGTVPPAAAPHGEFCAANARLPDEPWDERASPRSLACRFEGQTSWVARRRAGPEPVRTEAAAWRYGIGAIVTVFGPGDALAGVIADDAAAAAAAAAAVAAVAAANATE
jgi:hypothetical protein